MFTKSFVVVVDNDYLAVFLIAFATYLIFEREDILNFHIKTNIIHYYNVLSSLGLGIRHSTCNRWKCFPPVTTKKELFCYIALLS